MKIAKWIDYWKDRRETQSRTTEEQIKERKEFIQADKSPWILLIMTATPFTAMCSAFLALRLCLTAVSQIASCLSSPHVAKTALRVGAEAVHAS